MSNLLNDKIICSIECSKNKNLFDVRKMINDKIKGDFIFLDSNGKTIDIEDEQDYLIEDIFKNDEIKLNLKENISNSTSFLTISTVSCSKSCLIIFLIL